MDNQPSVASSSLHLQQQESCQMAGTAGYKRLDTPWSLGSSVPCLTMGDLIGSSAWRSPLSLGVPSRHRGSRALRCRARSGTPTRQQWSQNSFEEGEGAVKQGVPCIGLGDETDKLEYLGPHLRTITLNCWRKDDAQVGTAFGRWPFCQDGDEIFPSDGSRNHARATEEKTLQAKEGEKFNPLRGSPGIVSGGVCVPGPQTKPGQPPDP
ncbi:hypothetical protein B0T18DRAFT_42907 [Schizothecium vesticola]|uniref:Uncharacterized protein n=1 Tax=Schizothecium vesticola TaxID=314040 RepID=A0AA40KD13_9PEZI|nr:hypothetical protein B0T18DRAFT_42907 [Schizothecium vesticola]